MTALRIVLVCQWFRPEPVSQPGWIVDGLRRVGADPQVLTGVPNYPTGSVMPGYRAWRTSSEVLDRVPVYRTPLYPSHDASATRRMLNYLSWAVSSSLWGQRHLKSADVALVYSSPATAALPAMVARRRHGLPYVLLVQDVWPDSVFSSGFLTGPAGRLATRVVSTFVNAAYRNAAHIAVISPGMVELLESRGVPHDKISIIYNWVEHDQSSAKAPDLRTALGIPPDDFVVMYAGNHGVAQALDSIVRGFGEISESERCHLVLVGDGVQKESLKALARRVCPERAHFVEAQPRELMASVMAQADIQLVSLADRPLFAVTTPSKLQSIMAAGHPVLVSASGDAAAMVIEAGAGVAVPAESPTAVAAAVTRLRRAPAVERRAMGKSGEDYYNLHMSEDVGARKLIAVLETAAAKAIRPGVKAMSSNPEGNSQR